MSRCLAAEHRRAKRVERHLDTHAHIECASVIPAVDARGDAPMVEVLVRPEAMGFPVAALPDDADDVHIETPGYQGLYLHAIVYL